VFSWFKKRDAKIYPDDAIGNSLYAHCSDPAKLPEKVVLWYDVYFADEGDADAVAKHLSQRRIKVSRDHDKDPGDDFGPWNVDFELPVRARHSDLKTGDEEIQRLVSDYRGKVASCLLMPWDDDEGE
jgi:hypothetical protein